MASLRLIVLLGITATAATATSPQRAAVDLTTNTTTAFDPYLVTRSVGSSHAATALRADWRAQLAKFKQDVNPTYVRFHGLLDDDMSVVVSRDGNRYSFVNIFSVFDFLLSIDVRPIVELSFMPSLLAQDPDATVFYYRGGISAPADYDEWTDLISTLTKALIERYGLEEVASWFFEVWNEPNCGFFVEGGCCGAGCGDKSAYLDMFVATFRAVKAVDASLQVGGPATAQLAWLPEFIVNATAASTVPDFVSSHLYPTDPVVSGDRRGFTTAIEEAVQSIEEASSAAGLSNPPPLFLTEFNCGLSIDCADAPMASSFVVHHALAAQEQLSLAAPIQSFWTFSDIFEEQGQSPEEFSQAFGAQSINGVAKPVYRAMQLLQRLGTEALAVSGLAEDSAIDVVVTRSSNGVEVLATNFPNLTLADDLPPLALQIQFTGAAKPQMVEMRVIDDSNANALPLYYESGSPAYPDSSLLNQLHEESAIKVVAANCSGTDGSWTAYIELASFSVVSLAFAI